MILDVLLLESCNIDLNENERLLERVIKASEKVRNNVNCMNKLHEWVMKWFQNDNDIDNIDDDLRDERILLFKHVVELYLLVCEDKESIPLFFRRQILEQLITFMSYINDDNINELLSVNVFIYIMYVLGSNNYVAKRN